MTPGCGRTSPQLGQRAVVLESDHDPLAAFHAADPVDHSSVRDVVPAVNA